MQELSRHPFPAFTGINPNAITPAAQGGDRTFQAIFNTVSREMPQIPLAVQRLIEWFRGAHDYYRWYKLHTLQQQARDNGIPAQAALYGPAITFLANVSETVNFAVNFAIVTKCTMDILSKYRELNDSIREFQDTLCWKIVLQDSARLENEIHIYSLSVFLSFNDGVSTLFLQVIKIARCALTVLWKAFELSMILQDAYLFFNRDNQTRFFASTDLVVNWRSYSNLLNDELGRALEENQLVASEVLTELGENNSNQIVNGLISQLRTGVQSIRTFLSNNQGTSSSTSFLPFDGSGNLQRANFRLPTIPQRTRIQQRSTR
jgi:hypothetical protein